MPGQYIWRNPLFGTTETYQLVNGVWVLVKTDGVSFEHDILFEKDIDVEGKIKSCGDEGITQVVSTGGKTLTFKNGILVEFEEA